MANAMSLEKLPLEVIHQILSHLLPADLAAVRLASHSFLFPATSNPHWRRLLLDLLPSHASLKDVTSIPLLSWSFSLVPDGWFRAYKTVKRTAGEDWLLGEEDLAETTWIVFFKSHLRESLAASAEEAERWHGIIRFKEDRTCHSLSGMPLNSTSWLVDHKKNLIVPAYPPNVPSRDPFTWCRVLQHQSVLMLTDSIEFLSSLVTLNTQILEESVASLSITPSMAKTLGIELEKERKRALREREENINERLRAIHITRAEALGLVKDYNTVHPEALKSVLEEEDTNNYYEKEDDDDDDDDDDEEKYSDWSDSDSGDNEEEFDMNEIYADLPLLRHLQPQHDGGLVESASSEKVLDTTASSSATHSASTFNPK